MVKSLGDLSSGPVALVHPQKVRFFWTRNPTCHAWSQAAHSERHPDAPRRRGGWALKSPAVMCLLTAEKVQR